MKLIISGSTGFVGTEVLRQALSHPAIKEVVSLGRRETVIPQNLLPGANPAKLKSLICEDFLNYPESVRRELKGADACIWLDLSYPPILSRTFLCSTNSANALFSQAPRCHAREG